MLFFPSIQYGLITVNVSRGKEISHICDIWNRRTIFGFVNSALCTLFRVVYEMRFIREFLSHTSDVYFLCLSSAILIGFESNCSIVDNCTARDSDIKSLVIDMHTVPGYHISSILASEELNKGIHLLIHGSYLIRLSSASIAFLESLKKFSDHKGEEK